MPFKKRGRFYYSPSGRRYTARQVRAYYASGGWRKKRRRVKKSRTKGKRKRGG